MPLTWQPEFLPSARVNVSEALQQMTKKKQGDLNRVFVSQPALAFIQYSWNKNNKIL